MWGIYICTHTHTHIPQRRRRSTFRAAIRRGPGETLPSSAWRGTKGANQDLGFRMQSLGFRLRSRRNVAGQSLERRKKDQIRGRICASWTIFAPLARIARAITATCRAPQAGEPHPHTYRGQRVPHGAMADGLSAVAQLRSQTRRPPLFFCYQF